MCDHLIYDNVDTTVKRETTDCFNKSNGSMRYPYGKSESDPYLMSHIKIKSRGFYISV